MEEYVKCVECKDLVTPDGAVPVVVNSLFGESMKHICAYNVVNTLQTEGIKMLSAKENFEIYRHQTARSKVMDSLKLAIDQIKYLEAIMHRECASSPCILRQLEVSLRLVTALPDENFIVKEKE